ncbi:hypothetical protein ACJ7V3_04940 [Halomonas elongata]|uniref:hypothetical protein n=1 Tax=Halomonas elongata TaxID=2746 RepID=UPI0038D3F4ED
MSIISLGRCALFALPLVAASALADDGSDLTFQGDASFGGPHGGQSIQVALIDTASGEVLGMESGEVSADADPAFAFDFPGALQEGGSYAVHYWIDSNFGGGSVGSCDEMQNDHQWNVPIEADGGDVSHVESHDPSTLASVCDTFE